MPPLDHRLGVDVGGTNTDAVVLDRNDTLVAKAKVPTSPEVAEGIGRAVGVALRQSGIDRSRVTHLMLGTTHATNAVLERRNLQRVAVIRIGSPATHAVRPLFGWPADLRQVVSVGEAIVGGGIELDGRELAPFDHDGVARFLARVGERAEGVAIASVFAPVLPDHELMAEEVVRKELGDLPVSLSHRVGSIGLLERENATVLNAALRQVASDVIAALERSLSAHGLNPVTYFAQNDGTLMALDYALQYPVFTIGSGPANSIRGAAFLAGMDDALVVDVGGTSTDVGVVANGFPRESSQGVEIGGIRTNFRMPDLITLALGGGTVVAAGPDGRVQVGPRSVGYHLEEEALVFGGRTPTLTDAAVAGGRVRLGGKPLPEEHRRALAKALERVDLVLADAVDRIKTSKGDRPLIAVGGGSVLIPEEIPGVSGITRPHDFDVANAIGAAIASVSGQVDRIFHLGAGGREAALREACDDATERAVAAGADLATVSVVEIEEIPLAYLTTQAVRIRVKAAGSLGGL
jgi:N-methylhydantoinase A/oxoprolinase/acetone carboxylase beta subunit